MLEYLDEFDLEEEGNEDINLCLMLQNLNLH